MGRFLIGAGMFTLGVFVGIQGMPAFSAQVRTNNLTKLMRVDLGDSCQGKEVIVELNDLGPGTSGKHYHPGYSFAYVLQGSQTTFIDGKVPRTSRAGDVFYEPPMEVSASESVTGIKMVTVRLLEKGQPETTRVP